LTLHGAPSVSRLPLDDLPMRVEMLCADNITFYGDVKSRSDILRLKLA
jgi:hypothetical protein